MKTTHIAFWIILSCQTVTAWGQVNEEATIKEGKLTFETDKPFKLLELNEDKDPIRLHKKKRKPRVFYGIKTKKGFTQKGYKANKVIEKFYYLKKPALPNHFIRDIYWYDFTRQEVRKTKKFDPEKGVLLHGSYRKTKNQTLLTEGIFYKGTKHGRWMYYDKHGVLLEKRKYYKGWPKESIIVYYDPIEKTKTKEVIPIEHSEREGYYYLFHKNGTIAVFGEYKWNHKIGPWIENYTTGQRKKIILYPKDPFEKGSKPFVKSEWNAKGKNIYSVKRR